jgi:hypothetical protein
MTLQEIIKTLKQRDALWAEERNMLRVHCRDLMKQRDAALEKIAEMDADRPTAEERLTEEDRQAVAGIAMVVQRLKVYPEQISRTHRDDVELLWKIAERPFVWEEPSDE